MRMRVSSHVWLLFLLAALCLARMSWAEEALRILDIYEKSYDGKPAMAVITSTPLDTAVAHDKHLHLTRNEAAVDGAWVLGDDHRTLYFPNLDPETEYLVTVESTLTAANGQTLGNNVEKKVTTRKLNALATFASEGYILPSKLAKGLPVYTINVDQINIEFFRVKTAHLDKFSAWANPTAARDVYELEHQFRRDNDQWVDGNIRQHADLVYEGRFDLHPERNKRVLRHLPLDDIDALETPGVYFAVMRRAGHYNYQYQTTFFFVSDIGLHARIYRNGAAIYASSLQTGEALEDIAIELLDTKHNAISKGQTDEHGRFKFEGGFTDVRLVLARDSDSMSVLPLSMPELDLADFPVGTRPHQAKEFFVYGARDIYRPGETLTLSGLLRDQDGRPLAATAPVTALIFTPEGREFKRFTWTPHNANLDASLGYYQTDLTIPTDATTGEWHIDFLDDPMTKAPMASFKFQVEDFMPERLKLELSTTDGILLLESEPEISLNAQYLYGAPASDAKATGLVRIKAERALLPQWRDFQFGDAEQARFKKRWDLSEITLDQDGLGSYKIERRWNDITSPLNLRTTISVMENGGRPITRSIERQLWPANTLYGIRPLFDNDGTDEGTVSFELIHVDGTGALQAREAKITVSKEDRDYYWEYTDDGDWGYKHTSQSYNVYEDTIKLDNQKPTPYQIPLNAGAYTLKIQDADGKIFTSVKFYVGEVWWWNSESERAQASRPDKVSIEFDKPAYRPGDTAKLRITPPHDAQAIIHIEHTDATLWSQRVALSGKGSDVEIPVAPEWARHDIYVSVTALRPGDTDEKITPNRAIGLAHFPLDRSERQLNLSIEAPHKSLPETTLNATLKLAKPSSKPVYVTLAAVDVGILNITEFKTPDPVAAFFEARRYGVTLRDHYGKVIEIKDGGMADIRWGGDEDAGAGGKKPDTDVKLITLFSGPVAFDAQGTAQIPLAIPDFNGKIRLMALAFSEDSFGKIETEITIAAPLVATLNMPRFAAPGDAFSFALDLHNLSGAQQPLEVKINTGQPLSLSKNSYSVTLEDQQKTTLLIGTRVERQLGKGTIDYEILGKDIHIKRSTFLDTRPAYPAETRQQRDIISPQDAMAVSADFVKNLMPSTLDGRLSVSSSPPLDVASAVKNLAAYPYGCLEQTTSGAYPLLYSLLPAWKDYGLKPVDPSARQTQITTAFDRLAAMQLRSGGFGLWDKESPEEAWLTAYASEFLLRARDAGDAVPASMLDSALKRLQDYLENETGLYHVNDMFYHNIEQTRYTAKAYAAYVLARVNRASLAALRRMHEHHAKLANNPLTLVHLGIALHLAGDTKRGAETLQAALQLKRPTEGYYWHGDYGSATRDAALSYALLKEHQLSPPGSEALLFTLDELIRGRTWLSTQEQTAILRAGIAASLATGNTISWNGTLTVGKDNFPVESNNTYRHELEPSQLLSGIEFKSNFDAELYGRITVRGYPEAPPSPVNNDLRIEREWLNTDGKPHQGGPLKAGDLILVQLMISSDSQITDALLVDLLPAGFEIENQNLEHSVKLDDILIEDKPIWRWQRESNIVHQEFRDDRMVAALTVSKYNPARIYYLARAVTPGTFAVPPPLVESMYSPQLRSLGITPKPVVINAK
jgi:alpha-2-macroglobulin